MKAALALARPEIRELPPYAHAVWRREFTRLHANEAPWRSPGDVTRDGLNRYPEPQPRALLERLAGLYGVAAEQVLVTHGSDESIDLLSRTYLRAGVDAILQAGPTFAMYAHAARIQGAQVLEVPLRASDWALEPERLLGAWRDEVKIVYLCSPNNPTGQSLDVHALETVVRALDGRALVVLDEAYVEWSGRESLTPWLERFETFAILRTLSKAHALAGARIGALLGRAELIEVVRRVIMPYSLAQPSIEAALRALEPRPLTDMRARVGELIEQRERLAGELERCALVERVYPSDANFLLIECRDADRFLERALAARCLVRDLRRHPALARALRVSVGSPAENARLLEAVNAGASVRSGALAAPALGRAAPVPVPTPTLADDGSAGGAGIRGGDAAAGARCAQRVRETTETAVTVRVDLEREAPSRIATGLGFFDHMLEQLARHAGFALELECRGDLQVDEHHTVEDCALTLGCALRDALGDKRGIARYGFLLPMDEARAQVALDLSGRSYFRWSGTLGRERVGDLPTELVPHFFRSFADALGATLHIAVEGENCHHMIEACFKGLGRSLRQAVRREGDLLPSTKGAL